MGAHQLVHTGHICLCSLDLAKPLVSRGTDLLVGWEHIVSEVAHPKRRADGIPDAQ